MSTKSGNCAPALNVDAGWTRRVPAVPRRRRPGAAMTLHNIHYAYSVPHHRTRKTMLETAAISLGDMSMPELKAEARPRRAAAAATPTETAGQLSPWALVEQQTVARPVISRRVVTAPSKSVGECKAETGGLINEHFARCRGNRRTIPARRCLRWT